MTDQAGDTGRLRRLLRLRAAWRKRPSPPEASTGARSDEQAGQLRSEALDSNDLIRAEAPDDLETRRRADQLEREIKRAESREP
jgi:hypothetical protein